MSKDQAAQYDSGSIQFLKDLEGTEHAALIPKFAVLEDKTPGLFTEVMAREARFLVHGDAWMNNLLFAEEENVSVTTESLATDTVVHS